MKKEVYYIDPPKTCDVCNDAIGNVFYDCATRLGGWANCCEPCFKKYGRGTGTGLGQQFKRQRDGRFLKTKG